VAHRFDQAGSSTADLAREVAMSERQLQRKLRALLDTTPADYLREYRLTRAAQWLLEGRAAGTVALEAGFATQSHFTECFKARFGVTPGEYAASRQPPKRRRRRRD
ncbi:MAG TPA: helix-turn-helix transcriptional regulator, partial [Steroidobacteraceae bacterium]|nr:helix-turn-helix transcriptional regulator [Steroidobacteraceae bacterium]